MPVLRAPAKLNLYLHVTGRRADGYHLLKSLIVFAADVYDLVEITPSDTLSLTVTGPFAHQIDREPRESNLAVRAVQGAARLAGQDDRLAVRLLKNIPAGAGLGGGSADAAAAIRACEQLWQIALPQPARSQLLQSLGADVPVCDRALASFAAGIGEDLSPAPPVPPFHVLLLWPGVGVSTRDVFSKRPPDFSQSSVALPAVCDFGDLLKMLRQTRNDLEETAISICPLIGEAKQALLETAGCMFTRMTGSGSAVFGIFETPEACESARAAIKRRYPGWWAASSMV